MRYPVVQWVAVGLMGLLLLSGTLWATQIEMAAIGVYRSYASPALGLFVRCRFQPTCSVYALEALEREGFWIGNVQIAIRLLHCSPVGLLLS